jgi:Protein of unknown function (DUF3089)
VSFGEQTSKTRSAAVARIAIMWTKRNKATRWLWAPAVLGLVAGACGGDGDAETSGGTEAGGRREAVVDPYEGHTSATYDGTANWICHPDLGDGDQCHDLSATEVAPGGSTSRTDLEMAQDPPVDCFYLYPTSSSDPAPLADLDVDDSEESSVRAQAAPFATTCRVFAPAYRQIPLAAVAAGGGAPDDPGRETAYADVLDAWQTYVSEHNDGRGFVLVGHSQGTDYLKRLIAEEIVPEPALRERLVSAILLGRSTTADAFDGIPPCQAADQTGCVIAYVSYAAEAPPAADGRFGQPDEDGTRAWCVDPTELTGGGPADVIVPSQTSLIGGADLGWDVDTRYIVLPDAVDVSCAETADHTYLAVRPGDGWSPDEVAGLFTERLGHTWGLHLLDANFAMGNLLDIVSTQAEAYVSR